MGFALTPGEAPLHFSRSKNVMHVDETGVLVVIVIILIVIVQIIQWIGDWFARKVTH